MLHIFFRKKSIDTFSIELLFSTLALYLEQEKGYIIRKLYMPSYSRKPGSIIGNILWARKNQADINHISGDIHYAMLGFSNKNFNILTIHDCALLHKFPKNRLKYRIYKTLWFDLPIRKANVVTTISESTKSDIIQFTKCNPDKVIVIPNFINPEYKFTPKIFNSQKPDILHIGTASNKNLNRLIFAVRQLPCILTIVGVLDPETKELLHSNHIEFNNYVDIPTEKVIELYQKTDIVYFASLFEGFGMPIIEAQATGRPVITSDISPMREVAGKNACLVNPESTEDIRAAIIKICTDSDFRDSLVKYGLENCKRFSIAQVAERYQQLYEQR